MKYAAEALIGVAGNVEAKNLTRHHVHETIIQFSRYGQQTRHQRHQGLKRLLTALWENEGTPKLWQHVMRVPSPRPRNVTATEDEKRELLKRASPHLKCWVLLCSDLAIRSGTAAKLGPENYNKEKGTLTFTTKNGAKLTMPATAELRTILDAVMDRGHKKGTFVGALHRLGHVCGYTLRKEFNKAKDDAGITRPLVPHDLRRTTAVGVYRVTGKDLRAVQAVLGHKNLASTMHYLDHDLQPVSPAVLELAKLPPVTEAIQ